MKLLWLILPLLLIFGCTKPINDDTLLDKGGLMYHPDTKELYTGKTTKNRLGGTKEFEGSYKDGKEDGLWTQWYENGQKEWEQTYKNGKEDGLRTSWYENGQKEWEQTYKNGKEDGLWTEWFHYDGAVSETETLFKDGKFISTKIGEVIFLK